MYKLSYDLHIHSCLSPCGDDDMTPSNLVAMAALKGLDVVALTDHNTCKNCPAFMEVAKEYNIIAIPGMELTTAEEVHVLCLFPDLSNAMDFDKYVYDRLLDIKNNEKIFGKQLVLDKNENVLSNEPRLLVSSTSISFDNLWVLVSSFNGVMIPAHIDKASNSLLTNLGFVPPDSKFTSFELYDESSLHQIVSENNYLKKCNILYNSDAHYLEDIKEISNYITAESKDVLSILKAITSVPNTF